MTASPTTSAVRGPGTRPAWTDQLLVVASHKVRDRSTGVPYGWQPYGTQHAWAPGSRRTLCGEYVSGWTVFWERPFAVRAAGTCQTCVEASLPEDSRRRLDPIRLLGV